MNRKKSLPDHVIAKSQFCSDFAVKLVASAKQDPKMACAVCGRRDCGKRTMCIYSPPGTKVRFVGEKEWARKVLSIGTVCEVAGTKVGRCSSGVALVGFAGLFNTVMFAKVRE